MSLFFNCLIVVIVVFGVGFLAGAMLAMMHHAEQGNEEPLPVEIGEVWEDAEQ